MIPLARPAIDSADFVEDVVADRQNGPYASFFNAIKDSWKRRVRYYDLRAGSPEFVKSWSRVQPRAKTFRNLYAAKTPRGQAQIKMIADLRVQHGLTLCPSCGEPGRPNTLDHYLPKEDFPHLAVTPLNLVPMCDGCQGKKGTKTGGAAQPKWFLHPYFDGFVQAQVIFLSIQGPYDGPTFGLSVDPGLPAPQQALVSSHMRELQLEARFGEYFKKQFVRLLKNVRHMRETGQDVTVALGNFRYLASMAGANSWDHIFYAGVLDDAALMAHLLTGALPEFL